MHFYKCFIHRYEKNANYKLKIFFKIIHFNPLKYLMVFKNPLSIKKNHRIRNHTG